VSRAREIECCEDRAALAGRLAASPASVVAVRRLAHADLFPTELASAVARMPYEVGCLVAPVAAAAALARATSGDLLVFVRDGLLARLRDADADDLQRVLRVGISPWVGKPGVAQWEDDGLVGFARAGEGLAASFGLLGDTWRQLAEASAESVIGRA
jgi:hypothetical protein